MTNAELVEYAKNQLKAGSSANYIRTVLMKQGWGERDVNDALGIAQAEAGSPIRGAVSEAAGAAKPPEGAAKPKIESPSEKNKLLATAGLLTGIFLVITGGMIIYMLITFGNAISAMEVAFTSLGVDMLGMISGQIILCWVFAVIGLIAGVFWIITGIKEFAK